jgi:nucleoside-diphosphate-sugar epimerase
MPAVLIIGGSYFLGRVFVEKLLSESKFEIFVLNRGNIPIKKRAVKELICDRHDINNLKDLLPNRDWEAVVDFCAYTPSDVDETISALSEREVRQYIYISTATVYDKTNNYPITESAPKLKGPQTELGPFADYAYNKWLTELELEKQCAKYNIAYTVIRPAFIYGKYNYAPRESYFFDLIINKKTIIIPDNELALFSFVSVWDVAKILIGCIGNNQVEGNAFNASGEELISYPRFIEVLREITKEELLVQKMSIEEINRRQIPLPFPMDEHLIYSGTLIQEAIDFQYTPFLTGMGKTYRYYLVGKGLT